MLLRYRPRSTDWPNLHHSVLCRLAFKFRFQNDVLNNGYPQARQYTRTPTYIDGVATLLCDMGDGTKGARGEHDLMLIDERVFVHGSEDVTSGDVVTDLFERCKLRDLDIE